MLLSLDGRKIYFDLAGPRMRRSSASPIRSNADGGMWVEQMVPAAGRRLSRAAARHARPRRQRPGRRRLHDGRAGGRRERRARRAGHQEGALHRPLDRRHDRPGLRAGEPGHPRLALPVRHPAVDAAGLGRHLGGAQGDRAQQGPGGARRRHHAALVHRRVQAGEPARWTEVRDTISGTTPRARPAACRRSRTSTISTGFRPSRRRRW